MGLVRFGTVGYAFFRLPQHVLLKSIAFLLQRIHAAGIKRRINHVSTVSSFDTARFIAPIQSSSIASVPYRFRTERTFLFRRIGAEGLFSVTYRAGTKPTETVWDRKSALGAYSQKPSYRTELCGSVRSYI